MRELSGPNLLVGIETSDDAAVYRLSDEIAMIYTVDFITPAWGFWEIGSARADHSSSSRS